MMSVYFQLHGDDRLACDRQALGRVSPTLRRRRAIQGLFVPGLAAAVMVAVLAERWPALDTVTLTVALMLGLSISAVAMQLWRLGGGHHRWLAGHDDSVRIAVVAAGLDVADRDGQRRYAWRDLVAMEETDTHLFLHLKHGGVQIVPKRAFADVNALHTFTGLVRTLWAESPAHTGHALPSSLSIEVLDRRRWRCEHWQNLMAGVRLAFFIRTDPGRITSTPDHVLAIWVWILLLPAATDYVFALPDPRIDLTGFSVFGCATLIFFVSVATMAIAGHLRTHGMRLATMLSASQLVLVVPYVLIMDATDAAAPAYQTQLEWATYLIFMAWMLTIVGRSLRLLSRPPWPVIAFLTSLFAAWNYALTLQLPGQSFFYQAQTRGTPDAAAAPIDVEATYYRQGALLDREFKRLAPQTPGKTDFYFVGFAGDADQQVFTHEVEYVRDLLRRRYHTGGRSILLVNNAATIAELPLANAHNLAAALDAIGRRMDNAHDVLFLFLTSHGSSDHHLTVQFSPLGMDDLTPGELKDMLDHAGIRNRIIVVSACYSGGFLDVLKNDNSLIITASRRDRTSFGCSTERNFTYFGDAFFRDALNRTLSFTDAFEIARRIVAKREAREGDEPSEPQMYVGRKIARMLMSINTPTGAPPAAIAGGAEQ